jgi:GntR family transcriptional regulator
MPRPDFSRPAKVRAAPPRRVAKHQLIADWLLSEIEAGRWSAGDRLPSEAQLAAESGASVGTVQRALRTLSESGVVDRRQGSGTFVFGSRAPERHLKHFRFCAEGSETLLPVFFRVLELEETDEQGPWTTFLAPEGGRCVRLRRLVSVNREFDIYSEVYLPASRFGALARMRPSALDGVSIRDLLADKFNAPTLTTRQTVLCTPLPPRIGRHIGAPPGQYGLVITIQGMSFRCAPITWQRVFAPPSDRALEMNPWGCTLTQGDFD